MSTDTTDTSYCPHCGTVVGAGHAYCSRCGKSVTQAFQTSHQDVHLDEGAHSRVLGDAKTDIHMQPAPSTASSGAQKYQRIPLTNTQPPQRQIWAVILGLCIMFAFGAHFVLRLGGGGAWTHPGDHGKYAFIGILLDAFPWLNIFPAGIGVILAWQGFRGFR